MIRPRQIFLKNIHNYNPYTFLLIIYNSSLPGVNFARIAKQQTNWLSTTAKHGKRLCGGNCLMANRERGAINAATCINI